MGHDLDGSGLAIAEICPHRPVDMDVYKSGYHITACGIQHLLFAAVYRTKGADLASIGLQIKNAESSVIAEQHTIFD